MLTPISSVRLAHFLVAVLSLCAMGSLWSPSRTAAQQEFFVKPVAEKRLKALPAGLLYWRVENFPTLEQAQAAVGETSLAAEVSGKAWLFTLGPKGGLSSGATKRSEEHTSELQSLRHLVCRLLLEKK